jgi:hypothetical protein
MGEISPVGELFFQKGFFGFSGHDIFLIFRNFQFFYKVPVVVLKKDGTWIISIL